MSRRLDTSKEALEKLEIKLTDEQYHNLCMASLGSMAEHKNIPVFTILLILKRLGILPKELACDNGIENIEKGSQEWYNRMYGEMKEE